MQHLSGETAINSVWIFGIYETYGFSLHMLAYVYAIEARIELWLNLSEYACMYMWYLLQRIWWLFGVYALMDFPYTCIHMCDGIEGRIMAELMTPFHEIILLAIAWLIPLMFPKTLDMYHIILVWIYGNKWEANLLLPNIYLMHC